MSGGKVKMQPAHACLVPLFSPSGIAGAGRRQWARALWSARRLASKYIMASPYVSGITPRGRPSTGPAAKVKWNVLVRLVVLSAPRTSVMSAATLTCTSSW